MDVKIPLTDIYVGDGAFEAVSRVLKSGRYILGEETKNFEKEFAQKLGARYAVAVSSGTSALYLSMIACGLGKGDEVIVPSFSFIASASPIVDVGAKPVFCDVDNETLTIDPSDFERRITDRTKAVVPVHLFGHPANMDEICEIADEHSLKIIEDCAQAHGSMIGQKFAGSFGTASCYSFYPSKNMTVYGDGGMVTTNDPTIAEQVRLLRNHGRTEKYLHEKLGFNFRLSEIAAALGRYQLGKLDSFNEARRKAASFYDNELSGYVTTPVERPDTRHVYHMYVVRTKHRDSLKEFLSVRGIGVGVHYPIPIHLQPVFRTLLSPQRLPVTERECARVLSLPISPSISEDSLEYVTNQIGDFFRSNGYGLDVRSPSPALH